MNSNMLFPFKHQWADSFSINLLSCGMYTHRQCLGAFGQPQGNSKRAFRQRPAGCQKWVRGTAARPSFLSFQPSCPGLLQGSTNTLSVPSPRPDLPPLRKTSFICAATAPRRLCPLKPLFLPLSLPLSTSLYLYPTLSLPLSAPRLLPYLLG